MIYFENAICNSQIRQRKAACLRTLFERLFTFVFIFRCILGVQCEADVSLTYNIDPNRSFHASNAVKMMSIEKLGAVSGLIHKLSKKSALMSHFR